MVSASTLILLGVGAYLLFVKPRLQAMDVTAPDEQVPDLTRTPAEAPPFVSWTSFRELIGPQPDGSFDFAIGVSASGGRSPYTFTIIWIDGLQQSNSTGVFARHFPNRESVVPGGAIVVKDAEGRTAVSR